MKAIVLIALCSIAAASQASESAALFAEWKKVHGRFYASAEEHSRRLAFFHSNVQTIAKLNRAESAHPAGATFKLNKFADKSPEELRRLRGIKGATASWRNGTKIAAPIDTKAAPTSVDWRTKNVLAPVQDQGQCGSCWAFSATATLEAQAAIASGQPPQKLSEQFLVDCDMQCGTYRQEMGCDAGCDGGLQPNAWVYTKTAGGQPSESAYPYQGVGGTCQSSNPAVTTPSSWEFASQDETQIAAYVAQNGPVSVAVDAAQWSFYFGGIMHTSDVCPNGDSWDSLDHGVNIVGYGTDGGMPYWIIRNSWNADWGENGYCRILRGSGFCGVQLFACRAIVTN